MTLIEVICIITFGISIYKIIEWKIDSNKTKDNINEINKLVEPIEIKDNEQTVIIEQETPVPSANPYWDYIKMSLIDVDFSKLKEANNDTVGWIQVNGTNINYPFVQTTDNDFYLNHSFNKNFNNAGWVFLDYRNNVTEFDKNTIIYAHGRLDKTMFGTLKNSLSNGWLNNTNNYVIKLSTETENSLWQVFSLYHIPTTSDYITTNFTDDNSFIEFSNMLLSRSMYNFDTTVSASDKILTLSTCYNENEKMVLHAKLIKREAK